LVDITDGELLVSASFSGSFANAASGSDIPTADGLGRFTIYYGAGSSFPSNQVVTTNFRP